MNNESTVISPLKLAFTSFLDQQDSFHNIRLNFAESFEDVRNKYDLMQESEERLRHALKWVHKGPDLRLAKQVKTMLEKQNIFFEFRRTAISQGYDINRIGKNVFKSWVDELNKTRKKMNYPKLSITLEQIDKIYS